MRKLKILSEKDVCKILSDHGFIQVRQKGSPMVMQKKTENTTITVPVPNHSEIKMEYRFGKNFVTGVYIVEVRQGDNRSMIRLIKE